MARAAILAPAGPNLSAQEAAFFRDADPFGFILFQRNVGSPDDLRRLCADLRASVGRDAPILIDQEGGRVQRLRAPDFREWVPPLEEARRAGPLAARVFWLRYALIGAELVAHGIDVNCAPVADLAGPLTHPFLQNRCLGETADDVAVNARAAALGLLASGCLPIVKHAPGHGRAVVDSHAELPTVTAALDSLRDSDFRPFGLLADLPIFMTAHVVYTALDGEHPATLSRTCLNFVRQELGFKGLMVSDDLSMKALGGSLADKVGSALAAGCDVVLHCNGDFTEMVEVAKSAGRLTGEGEKRAASALAMRQLPSAVEPAALIEEYRALTGGV